MRSAITLGVLTLVASGLSACLLPGLLCEGDHDCPTEQWCLDGACIQNCTNDDDCFEGFVCRADHRGCVSPEPPADGGFSGDDGGAVDDGGGPDTLAVSLDADTLAPAAGAVVTLSWSTGSVADECSLTAQSRFDAAHVAVAGAPTTGKESFEVEPVQDTEYRVLCTRGADFGSATVFVDVAAEGTLTAAPAQLNGGEQSSLSWSTRGAAACVLAGPEGFSFDIPLADTPAGSATLPSPEPGDYVLSCDAAELARVELAVARVRVVSVTPEAIGPGTTTVRVVFAYLGPGACTLAGLVVEPAGTDVVLDETTTLEVLCEGYDNEELVARVDVPQLISSFTGPAAPVPYGDTATLSWSAPAGASCTLDGVAVSGSPYETTALLAGRTFTLACSEGGKTAEAELVVEVLPGFVGAEVTGALWKAAGASFASEAAVRLTATTTLNATSCSVGGFAMEGGEVGGGEKTWTLEVVRGAAPGPAAGGAQSYSVSCVSSGTDVVTSGALVTAWWGSVTPSDFTALAASEATLVTLDVTISGPSPATSSLAALREVGARLRVETSGIENLVGVENVERILGTLQLVGNDNLRRTYDVFNQSGFVALREVRGALVIGHEDELNAQLQAVEFPALQEVGGALTISTNGALTSIAMPKLSSVGGALTIEGSSLLLKGAAAPQGFPSLTGITGNFAVIDTSLISLTSYFPLLHDIAGGQFQATGNSILPCTNVEDFYCQAGQGVGIYIAVANQGACSPDPPTCLEDE
jgi:hypothetical protein